MRRAQSGKKLVDKVTIHEASRNRLTGTEPTPSFADPAQEGAEMTYRLGTEPAEPGGTLPGVVAGVR